MKTRMKFILAVLLILVAAGPAFPVDKDMLQLQKDVIDLIAQVKVIQSTMDQNNTAVKALVEKMYDQVNTLSSTMQKMSTTVDTLKGQGDSSTKEMRTILTNLNGTVGDLKDGLEALRLRMDSLSKDMAAAKTTSTPLEKPDDLWRSAYVDYSAGNYDLAIGEFQDFVSKYATDPRGADAHLYVAESLRAQKKYDQALNEYDIVLQKYPDSDKSKTALLKKGYALAESNQVPQAVTTFKQVVSQYPNTIEASDATGQLKELQQAVRKPPAARPGAVK